MAKGLNDKEYYKAINLIRKGADMLMDEKDGHYIMWDIHLDDNGFHMKDVETRAEETPTKDIAELIRRLADIME